MDILITIGGVLSAILYLISLTYITFYCLIQLNLYWNYKSNKKDIPQNLSTSKEVIYPKITVQLPIFNERYVVNRLIDKICALDYPTEQLEIQVLDDSTDETVDLVKAKVSEYQAKGINIKHIKRKIRAGYKAGALKEATAYASGEFIAIFDADFLPEANFLKQTIPYFENENIGVVQTRWGHLNEEYSLLTRLQAFQLNVHFSVEQTGRAQGDLLLQFNGTAGVWRKQCIADAGGWEADTLTEDLDLSYRAQIKGWKIKYLEDVESPAELPAEMNSLKTQQYRWMKGGAETAKKALPNVWASEISFFKKIHASGHLLGSTIFVFILIAAILSVPTMLIIDSLSINTSFMAIYFVGLLSIIFIYYEANVRQTFSGIGPWPKKVCKFIFLFPVFLALSMGLSLHNSIAVLQGFFGKKTPFVRTPKFDIIKKTDQLSKKSYLPKNVSWSTLGEGLLMLYFTAALIYGFTTDTKYFLIYHLMLAVGFGTIFFYSLHHLRTR